MDRLSGNITSGSNVSGSTANGLEFGGQTESSAAIEDITTSLAVIESNLKQNDSSLVNLPNDDSTRMTGSRGLDFSWKKEKAKIVLLANCVSDT